MTALPAILSDLSVPLEEGGELLSLGATAYMIFKPSAQIVSDMVDGQRMLICSLICSGLTFIGIAFARSLLVMQVLIVLLQLFQAMHAPAMLKILTVWFYSKERTTGAGAHE